MGIFGGKKGKKEISRGREDAPPAAEPKAPDTPAPAAPPAPPPTDGTFAILELIQKKLNHVLNQMMSMPEWQKQVGEVLSSVAKQIESIDNLHRMLHRGLDDREKKHAEAVLDTRKQFSSDVQSLKAALEQELKDQAAIVFIQQLLPAVDDLEVTIARRSACVGDPKTLEVLDAVDAIRTKIVRAFRMAGLEVIEVKEGEQEFDQEQHDAVGRERHDSAAALGAILRVQQRGYRFRGRVIRRPQVIVKGE